MTSTKNSEHAEYVNEIIKKHINNLMEELSLCLFKTMPEECETKTKRDAYVKQNDTYQYSINYGGESDHISYCPNKGGVFKQYYNITTSIFDKNDDNVKLFDIPFDISITIHTYKYIKERRSDMDRKIELIGEYVHEIKNNYDEENMPEELENIIDTAEDVISYGFDEDYEKYCVDDDEYGELICNEDLGKKILDYLIELEEEINEVENLFYDSGYDIYAFYRKHKPTARTFWSSGD